MRAVRRVVVAMGMALAGVLAAAVAEAGPPPWWVGPRTFGVGMAVGGGVSYNVVPSLRPPSNAWGPQADFLNLELRFFFRNQHALHVYSQLGNTLVSAIASALRNDPTMPGELVFASLGVLYDVNLRFGDAFDGERRRWILAPGLEIAGDYGFGGSYLRTRPAKFAVRIPIRWGVEWLVGGGARGRPVGYSLMLRSFFEPLGWAQHDGPPVITQGFAALIEGAVVWY
jgi:hypothetical protein